MVSEMTDDDYIEIEPDEIHVEYAPEEILNELHKLGHELIGLVVKIMEAPAKNAHYTNEINAIVEETEEFFSEHGIKGDGNTPQPLAQPLGATRTLSDVFVDMAQIGINGLIDGLRRDE